MQCVEAEAGVPLQHLWLLHGEGAVYIRAGVMDISPVTCDLSKFDQDRGDHHCDVMGTCIAKYNHR